MSDEDLVPKFDKNKSPRKKRSKFKWLLFIIFIIFICALGLFGVAKFGYVEIPPYVNQQVERLIEKSSEIFQGKSEEVESVTQTLPMPEMPLKTEMKKDTKEKRSLKVTGNYFIHIGSCLCKSCINDFGNKFKQMGLPLITRNSVEGTNYFELISETAFLKKRAEEKLRLLNKYNKTNGFPYLVPGKTDHMRISFGLFPQQSNALRMKSHLEQLYPMIRIRFQIHPRKDNTTITKLYIGPFNKMRAENTMRRLQKNPDFDWISITKKL